MCRCLTTKEVRRSGYGLLSFILIMSIICFFVQGYDFQQSDMSWAAKGEWRFTAIFQVSSIIFVFIFSIIGLGAFITVDNKSLQITYFTLGVLSTIYSFCISVFVFAAADINYVDLPSGCNDGFRGIFQNFQYLKTYFKSVDEVLCGTGCECYLSNKTAIEEFNAENIVIAKKGNPVDGVTNIDQCIDPQIFFPENATKVFGEINQRQFHLYWKRIEKKFKCVGWCPSFDTVILKKYLFSDINGGIVQNIGCMKMMIDWLPKMLNTFASVLLIICVAQGTSCVFMITLYCDYVLDDSEQRRTERQEDNIPIKMGYNTRNENDNRELEMKEI